jgi:hypothetical protein
MNQELWIGLAEVWALPGCEVLANAEGAFTHIITWAGDGGEFREKAEMLARHLRLQLVGLEGEEAVKARQRRSGLGEDIQDLIRQAEDNPQAILYGTFHKYPIQQA